MTIGMTGAAGRAAVYAAVLAGTLMLAACAHQPNAHAQIVRYDLGPPPAKAADTTDTYVAPVPLTPPPAVPLAPPPEDKPTGRHRKHGKDVKDAAASAALTTSETAAIWPPAPPRPVIPMLKVMAVTGPASLDSDQIPYRLTYADPHEAYSYVHSRWTAPPAQLLTERLRAGFSPRIRVLDGGDPDPVPMLKVELLDFAQRFDAPRQGVGVVAIRASYKVNGRLAAQREFSAAVPCRTADAAGGAAAIAAASDEVLDQLGVWIEQMDHGY